MKLNPRQKQIIEIISHEGPQFIEILAKRLTVSVQTIRRDVSLLDQQGILCRFHGGVYLPETGTPGAGSPRSVAELLPYRVAQDIPDGSTLLLYAGDAGERIARHLMGKRRLRVITNSLSIASLLRATSGCEVTVIGGQVRHHDGAILGEQAIASLRHHPADICIIPLPHLKPNGHIHTADFQEARFMQAVLSSVRFRWGVIDEEPPAQPALAEAAYFNNFHRVYCCTTLPVSYNTLIESDRSRFIICSSEPEAP